MCTDCRGGRERLQYSVRRPVAEDTLLCSMLQSKRGRTERRGSSNPSRLLQAVQQQQQHCLCRCCKQTTKSGVSLWGLCPPAGGGAGGGGGVGATCRRAVSYRHLVRGCSLCSSLQSPSPPQTNNISSPHSVSTPEWGRILEDRMGSRIRSTVFHLLDVFHPEDETQ